MSFLRNCGELIITDADSHLHYLTPEKLELSSFPLRVSYGTLIGGCSLFRPISLLVRYCLTLTSTGNGELVFDSGEGA